MDNTQNICCVCLVKPALTKIAAHWKTGKEESFCVGHCDSCEEAYSKAMDFGYEMSKQTTLYMEVEND